VLFLLKEYIRILANAVVTFLVVIEEKNDHLSDVTIAIHNPVASEGLFNDLNIGKSARKKIFEELEPYILNIEEITQ
jgi:hypothetical protein